MRRIRNWRSDCGGNGDPIRAATLPETGIMVCYDGSTLRADQQVLEERMDQNLPASGSENAPAGEK